MAKKKPDHLIRSVGEKARARARRKEGITDKEYFSSRKVWWLNDNQFYSIYSYSNNVWNIYWFCSTILF